MISQVGCSAGRHAWLADGPGNYACASPGWNGRRA